MAIDQVRPSDRNQDSHLEQHHALVLAGVVSAGETLTAALLPLVRARLSHLMPRFDQHSIEDCVEDAILVYLRSPAMFRPHRGVLSAWITTIALNKARDLRRRDRRRSPRLVYTSIDDLRLAVSPHNDPGPPLPVVSRTELLTVAYTEAERRFLLLRLEGVRSSTTLARALNIDELEGPELRAEVHRTWARLRARLEGLKHRGRFSLASSGRNSSVVGRSKTRVGLASG